VGLFVVQTIGVIPRSPLVSDCPTEPLLSARLGNSWGAVSLNFAYYELLQKFPVTPAYAAGVENSLMDSCKSY
jgi:hypothetical protein